MPMSPGPSLSRSRPTRRAISSAAVAAGLGVCAAAPLAAAPLSKCPLNNQSEYVSPADRTLSEETRKEVRLRVLIDALDAADIVFRGRLTERRYLSDITQTFVPAILEVYDNVSLLKGAPSQPAADGKLYLVREKMCNGGCPLNTLPEVLSSEKQRERVVLALANTLPDPAEAKDRWSGKVVYTGRIDALGGPCDPYQVNESSVVALFDTPGEFERLKRAYPKRTAEEKSRDQREIARRFLNIH